MANQQFGRPSGVKQLPVRVSAPLGHRAEGRVKPGVVQLTSRDAAVQGSGGTDAGPGIAERSSTSQGAGLLLEHGEELLDYEEEKEVHEVAVQTGTPVERPKVSKRAVKGDRPVGRHQELVAGNLLRGEDFGYEPRRVASGNGNVDVAIQVGIGTELVAGKSEVSQGGVADVVPVTAIKGAAVGFHVGGGGAKTKIGIALGSEFTGTFEFCL
ncbi:hypothetical protein NDU88_003596 [Pleurodeles waltl]|uniref:Uncharacterized protein n=1 Tax=Pleurodeles waltl TaxID=8319 RepID=A0AAV7W5S0_PLEWA|nr:hypothetical protein NDU88_003596 [Pleurodeles waltl]